MKRETKEDIGMWGLIIIILLLILGLCIESKRQEYSDKSQTGKNNYLQHISNYICQLPPAYSSGFELTQLSFDKSTEQLYRIKK